MDKKVVRTKLLIMFAAIGGLRILSQFPVPGIDTSVFQTWMLFHKNPGTGFLSALTGGSFEKFSIFALGITPYITATIILQILGLVFPSIEMLQNDGQYGKKQIKKVSAVIAIILALTQSMSMAIGFGRSGLIEISALKVVSITFFMTLGTGITIWIANLLTEKTYGDGTSILLMVNILSTIPESIHALFKRVVFSKEGIPAVLTALLIISILFFITAFIVLIGEGVKNIPVFFSKKMSYRNRMEDTGYIPLKVNFVGVLPVIFASTVFAVPQMIASITGKGYGSGYSKIFLNTILPANWLDPEHPEYSIGLLLYIALIIFFSYCYYPIAFNAQEVADTIRKHGGMIPNVRIGTETEKYLEKTTKNIAIIGTFQLLLAVLIPMIFDTVFKAGLSMGGTSLLIVTSVTLNLCQQIKADMQGIGGGLLQSASAKEKKPKITHPRKPETAYTNRQSAEVGGKAHA